MISVVPRRPLLLLATVGFLLATASGARAQPSVTVPATSNPWLAGMPDGTTASFNDSAPAHSPVQVAGPLIVGGKRLSFNAVGYTDHCPAGECGVARPDGDLFEGVIAHAVGSEHGIATISAPWDAMIGVFLSPERPDLSPAPQALDFSSAASRDFAFLAPGLKQPFFIGDGRRLDGTTVQIFEVPVGATRLFLGTMDSWGWFNNSGALTVQVVGADETSGYTRFFAEGATSTFFDTRIALLNPNLVDTTATLTFMPGQGTPITHALPVAAGTRVTVDVGTLPGMNGQEFSTKVQSNEILVADRTMTWDSDGYGAHAETAVTGPSPIWYLAEGATHSGFSLFYLLQNPAPHATTVRVRYLRTIGPPLEKQYTLGPESRTNIWVNVEDFPGEGTALASAEFSAVIESLDATPIIVERAMYRSNQGRLFNAGHESAGVTSPATSWFLAEGATGDYFDQFILIANPTAMDAQVTLTYLLDGGQTYSRTLMAPANARSGVWVDVEEFPGIPGFPLADVAVSTTVESTNGVPLVVERAMWWPGNGDTWHEAHNSAGATATGTRWAVAEGEVGGPRQLETYLLVANTSASAGSAAVTLHFEDGTTATRTYALAPQSRTNVAVGPDFGTLVDGKRFGAVVESIGETPAQIVVERAMYSNAGGVGWAAGTNAVATRLP